MDGFPFYAQDIMTTSVIMAKPQMSLQQLEALLVENRISGAPVVDDNGQLVGVISMSDIIASGERLPYETPNYFRDVLEMDALLGEVDYGEVMLSEGFVADYMTREVFTVTPATPLQDLARTMYEERIHRLVVIEPDSRIPVGVISTFDLLKVLAGQATRV